MTSIFDNTLLSKEDREQIQKLKEAYKATDDKAQKEQIHQMAETIRSGYGYSGGGDGSQFIPFDTGVIITSDASANYIEALNNAEQNRQAQFDAQIEAANADESDRLRDAYIKNMQSLLGLDELLKANGISGGMTESTYANLNNNYNVIRDGIKSDSDATRQKIETDALNSLYESGITSAKAEYDASIDRANRLTAAEQKNYDRQQDALEWNYRAEQDAYNRAQDEYKKQYQAQKDAYQKQQDALEWEYKEKEYELAKQKANETIYSNKSTSSEKVDVVLDLIDAGYYSPDFAKVLGFEGLSLQGSKLEEAKEGAWKMLAQGVYDKSFVELLGFPAEILQQYAQHSISFK